MRRYYNYDGHRGILFRIKTWDEDGGYCVKVHPVKSAFIRKLILFRMLALHFLGNDMKEYICFTK